jgi:hypothetical protein
VVPSAGALSKAGRRAIVRIGRRDLGTPKLIRRSPVKKLASQHRQIPCCNPHEAASSSRLVLYALLLDDALKILKCGSEQITQSFRCPSNFCLFERQVCTSDLVHN